jgi:hypothetical protein
MANRGNANAEQREGERREVKWTMRFYFETFTSTKIGFPLDQ